MSGGKHICKPKVVKFFGTDTYQCGCGKYFSKESEMVESLFGGPISMKTVKPVQGKYKMFKAKNNYKKSYIDQRCANCTNFVRVEWHCKPYLKCRLLGLSHSEASDIRASYICDQYDNSKEDKR